MSQYIKTRQKIEHGNEKSFIWIFLLLHIPLAYLLRTFSFAAELHALLTLGVGVWFALHAETEKVVFSTAYIVGSEVLWRAVGANIFWEFGKYAVCLILLVYLLRIRDIRPPVLSVLFFVPLLPSILLTLDSMPLGEAREAISFNLSGALSIFLCSVFFSKIVLSSKTLKRAALVYAAPLLGIVTLQLISIASSQIIKFSDNSNFTTSGGFGPNQVSSILGVGALAMFLLLVWDRKSKAARPFYYGLFIVFLGFCALTFSRNGVYLAVLGSVAALIFAGGSFSHRLQNVFLVGVVALVVLFVVFPWVNSLTNGMLQVRLSDTGLTGRDRIAQADLQIWQDNFWFGVGPGVANDIRALYYSTSVAAHTEITRLLAEHGSFGLFSLLVLIGMSISNLMSAKKPLTRSTRAALLMCFWVYIAANAMRLVLPGYLLGITFSQEEKEQEP